MAHTSPSQHPDGGRRLPQLICRLFVGGVFSLPALIFVWAGLWNILDLDVPGGTGLGKEILLAAIGAVIMVWTRTFFSNSWMDAYDEAGRISKLRTAYDGEKINGRDKFSLYWLSLWAMAGSIIFWDGVYTICEEHVWDNTWRYNLVCTALGGVGIVWVVTSELYNSGGWDVDTSTSGGGGGGGGGSGSSRNSTTTTGFASLSVAGKTAAYSKALFGNACAVVFWKGLENLILEGPESDWTGLVVYVVGLALLVIVGRYQENVGLDEDDAEATGKVCCCRYPSWLRTGIELCAVVAAWTGIEWYNWEDDYIPRTWYRDILYIVGGLLVLLVTGTFLNLARTPLSGVAGKAAETRGLNWPSTPQKENDVGRRAEESSPASSTPAPTGADVYV